MHSKNSTNQSWSIAPAWRIDRPFLATQLSENKRCHTAIIGGGITGLAAAFRLALAGKSVVVLDTSQLGEGSTGWCAGILSKDTTVELSILEAAFGCDNAKLIANQLVDLLKMHQQSLGKDCDWQSGNSLCLGAKPRHRKSFVEEVETLNEFDSSAQFLEKQQIPSQLTGFSSAFQMGNEHAVHPVKLLFALAGQVKSNGGEVFENSPVVSWEFNGKNFVVRCGAHEVVSDNLICSQGMKTSGSKELERFRRLLIPANGHIFVTKPVENTNLSQGCINFWDSLQLYHYGRYLPDNRILVGGMDAPGFIPNTALAPDDSQIRKLYAWAHEHHAIALPPIEHAWRASLTVPFDGMPVLASRQLANNNTLITAVTDGIPSALMLGQAVLELIDQQESELHSLFSHKRRLSLAGQVLSRVPTHSFASKFVHNAAFAALALWDALP
ncbi:MAG: FAD-binding oxidoreductase [Candidatus Obscuribacterales bacterium]|nr:FAD-binding oxidoreductase [Candidatus Obscuribacterales bacterium]